VLCLEVVNVACRGGGEPLYMEGYFPAAQEWSFPGKKAGMRGASLILIFQLGETAPKPMTSVQPSVFVAEVLLAFCLLQTTSNCWLSVNFYFVMYHQPVVFSPFSILAQLSCGLQVWRLSAQNAFICWWIYYTERTPWEYTSKRNRIYRKCQQYIQSTKEREIFLNCIESDSLQMQVL